MRCSEAVVSVLRLILGLFRRGFVLCVLLSAMLPVGAQSIEGVLAPGELIKGHVKAENDCSNCHVRFNPKGQDALCMACHKEVGRDVKDKQGYHGRLKAQTCRSCHTDHRGRLAKIVQLDTKHFDHRQTDYQLKGKHQKVACDECHVPTKRYWEAASDCFSCHKKDDEHKGGLGKKCADCHSEADWKTTDFNHDKDTDYPLEGKHAKVKCNDCHADGRYKDTPETCIGCHKKDDEHKGQYGNKCESCHSANSWKEITFNHDADTKYPLRGKHRTTACNECHTGALYRQKLSDQCWDCHKRDDKHKESLGKDCASCHSESGWKDPPRFDHGRTRFPLLGKHIKADCKDCHKNAMYKEAPLDCFACHEKDDKHEGTLGKACVDCHTERDWKSTEGRFDHDKTKFALRGGHATSKIKCGDCHKGGLKGYRGTDTTCFSCHKKDDKHDGTQGQKCEQCHTDKDWKSTAFDHGKTKFPLTGAHKTAKCDACHVTKRFKEVKLLCVECHLKEDQHKGKLGTKCETCHNARHWKSWDFNHDIRTKFPLTGAHIKVKCEACHTRVAPPGRPIHELGQRCLDCHAKDDVHDGEFGPRCEQCHGTQDWKQIDKRFSRRSVKGPYITGNVQSDLFYRPSRARQRVS
jgi:hypothetical protein